MDKLPKLYKKSVNGAILEWLIEVDKHRYRTLSGQVGGQITSTAWTECKGKNTGKANQTTPEEQALKEATSKWNKKQEREQFVVSLNEVDAQKKFIQPMLAKNYAERSNKLDFTDGVWVQCKLNGVRCIATKSGLFSRKGTKWNTVPHIEKALEKFFKKNPDAVLDGELFNENLRQDLGSIISLIAKKEPTEEDLNKSKELVQFHIYDTIADETYEKRLQKISQYTKEIASTHVCLVDTHKVGTLQEIDNFLSTFEQQQHEGAMIRTNGIYENKRSNFLLKYKSFLESEFQILDVVEGLGNLMGKAGSFILKDEKGNIFNSSPTGSHEYWTQLWCDRGKLRGKFATVKYKELTPVTPRGGGVPSFGKVVAIRDYED